MKKSYLGRKYHNCASAYVGSTKPERQRRHFPAMFSSNQIYVPCSVIS